MESPSGPPQSGLMRRGKNFLMAKIGSGWHLPDDSGSKNRDYLVRYNLTANTIANLIGGNFFTGLLLLMKADDSFIGLITIIIFATNMLQLFAPYLLERFEKRKNILIASKVAIHVINIIIVGLIPAMPGSVRTHMYLMAGVQVLINGINAFIGPGMSVWHMGHVPNKVRVAYFSTVSMLNGVVVAVVNLLASFIVDHFKRGGNEFAGLWALRIIALLIAVYDIWTLSRIEELSRVKAARKIDLKALFVLPWKEKVYLRTVAITVIWNAIANLPGSYYSVYLLRHLNVSYSYIMTISSLNVVVLMLAMPFWRKIYIRFSWLKPLAASILLHAVHYIILSFVSEKTMFLYPVGMIWAFICAAGINLGFSSVAYINIPEENQTLYIGFYSTMANLGALFASTVSRELITRLEGLQFDLFGILFCEKQLLMLVVGILVAGVGCVILTIYKRNKAEGRQY